MMAQRHEFYSQTIFFQTSALKSKVHILKSLYYFLFVMYYMHIKLLFVETIYGEKREMTSVEKSNLGPSGSFI